MTKISNQYSLTNILTADLANSRLGINNVSPTVALDVTGAGKFSSTLQSNGGFIQPNQTEIFASAGASNRAYAFSVGNVAAGDFTISQGSTATGGTYTTRLTINPSGNVGIGTSSPTYNLQINSSGTSSIIHLTNSTTGALTSDGGLLLQSGLDMTFTNREAGRMSFETSNTERMRITSDGNIGIRTTTPQGKLHVVTTGSSFTPTDTGFMGGNNNYRVHIQSTEPGLMLSSDINGAGSATGTQTYQLGLQIGWLGTNDIRNNIYFGGALLSFVYSANQGTSGSERMRISTNGSIGAPNGTNIYNASDARLKKNINTTTYGLDTISALNPVKFNWVDGFEPTEDGKDMLGFIAQEVQTVIPEAIESFGGDINLNGELINNPLRVNEKFIIPVLVKAIQELSAKVSLLENK